VAGFFVHNILLGGSIFDNQIVPDTTNVLLLSCISVLITFAMQMALAWYHLARAITPVA
jgi:hypothetical protein